MDSLTPENEMKMVIYFHQDQPAFIRDEVNTRLFNFSYADKVSLQSILRRLLLLPPVLVRLYAEGPVLRRLPVVGACLPLFGQKDIAQHLDGALSHNAVRRDAVDGVSPKPGVIRAERCRRRGLLVYSMARSFCVLR